MEPIMELSGSKGPQEGSSTGAPRGMTYTYRLQAVDLDGMRVWLGTATAA
jgi:hypothetical protein